MAKRRRAPSWLALIRGVRASMVLYTTRTAVYNNGCPPSPPLSTMIISLENRGESVGSYHKRALACCSLYHTPHRTRILVGAFPQKKYVACLFSKARPLAADFAIYILRGCFAGLKVFLLLCLICALRCYCGIIVVMARPNDSAGAFAFIAQCARTP